MGNGCLTKHPFIIWNWYFGAPGKFSISHKPPPEEGTVDNHGKKKHSLHPITYSTDDLKKSWNDSDDVLLICWITVGHQGKNTTPRVRDLRGPLYRQETKSPKPAGVKEDLNLRRLHKKQSPRKKKGKSCRITHPKQISQKKGKTCAMITSSKKIQWN